MRPRWPSSACWTAVPTACRRRCRRRGRRNEAGRAAAAEEVRLLRPRRRRQGRSWPKEPVAQDAATAAEAPADAAGASRRGHTRSTKPTSATAPKSKATWPQRAGGHRGRSGCQAEAPQVGQIECGRNGRRVASPEGSGERTARTRARESGSASALPGAEPRAGTAPRPRPVRRRSTGWPPYRTLGRLRRGRRRRLRPAVSERVEGVDGGLISAVRRSSSSRWKSGIHSAPPAASRAFSAASRLLGQIVAHLRPGLGWSGWQSRHRPQHRSDAQEEGGPVAPLAALADASSRRRPPPARVRRGWRRRRPQWRARFQACAARSHVVLPRAAAPTDGITRGVTRRLLPRGAAAPGPSAPLRHGA